MKRLAIIPARSGSKRIKNKNIKSFLGKPIIDYSIELAKNSKLFDEIHISTDSKKYIDIVEKHGIKNKFLRPKNLSDDKTPLLDVMKYVVKKYESLNFIFDEIFIILPCNPLVDVKDLKKAHQLFIKNKKKYPVMPVLKYSAPLQWALILKNNKITPYYKDELNMRSQKFKDLYYDSASFYIFPKNYINYNSVEEYAHNFIAFETSQFNSVDIDNKDNWLLAEALYEFKRNKLNF